MSFSITSYRKTQTNVLANPIEPTSYRCSRSDNLHSPFSESFSLKYSICQGAVCWGVAYSEPSQLINTKFKGFHGASVVKNPPIMQEMGIQSLGREDPLKKAMATDSSIPASVIPRTEEPGRLSSLGSQRVGHDLVTPLWGKSEGNKIICDTRKS